MKIKLFLDEDLGKVLQRFEEAGYCHECSVRYIARSLSWRRFYNPYPGWYYGTELTEWHGVRLCPKHWMQKWYAL